MPLLDDLPGFLVQAAPPLDRFPEDQGLPGGGAGDEPGNAQNLDSLLGKLIRIDPRRSGNRPYTVPASNPFVGRYGRDEIFAYGLRNPFRWSFDRTSSKENVRIAIGDVGQDSFEEINYLNLSRARTTFIITHRLSLIRRANRILVLRTGRVADQGRHEELLARSEDYRRIFAGL